MQRTVYSPILSAAACAALACLSSTAPAQSAQDIYRNLKSLEGRIPLPTPSVVIRIPRAFAPISAGDIAQSVPRLTGAERASFLHPTDRYTFHANAVNVGLRFECAPGAGSMSVTCEGHTAALGGAHSSVVMSAGRKSLVTYRIQAGDGSYSGTVAIVRPPIIGAGVFIIPALPRAIIYEPQDARNKNRVTYTSTQTVGNTSSVALGQDSSTTTPATPTKFADVATFQTLLNGAASLAHAAGGAGAEGAGGVGDALSAFAGGLGSASATQTQGATVTSQNQLSIALTAGDSRSTGEHRGPGLGDRILYYRNARLAWMAKDGEVTLCLLGCDGVAADSVYYLKEALAGRQSLNGLPPRAAIEAMLALDPFYPQGPSAALPADRFVQLPNVEGSGAGEQGDAFPFSHSVSTADLNASASYTTTAEDYRAGWLSFLGIGVTETQSTRATTTLTRSSATTVGSTVSTDLVVYVPSGQRYVYRVFYDRVFGTLAFLEDQASPSPTISGTMVGSDGKPIAHQLVTLSIGGRKFLTRTDAAGKYAFHSTDIKPGTYLLTGPNIRRSLELKGAPIRDLQLAPLRP